MHHVDLNDNASQLQPYWQPLSSDTSLVGHDGVHVRVCRITSQRWAGDPGARQPGGLCASLVSGVPLLISCQGLGWDLEYLKLPPEAGLRATLSRLVGATDSESTQVRNVVPQPRLETGESHK